MAVVSGPLLARLAALDTCACSDAMDKIGLAGVASGLRPVTVPRKVTGRVITVQYGPVSGTHAARHSCTAAIDAAGLGDVIVVAVNGRLDAAAWGGLLSLGATLRGVGGVVTDGACRDVDEAIALGLPVYAVATTPLTARGRHGEVAWNVPVVVAGVTVHPGDLVIADGSGVVFLPAEHAEQVIHAAQEVAARETAMSVRIKSGESVAAVLSADYERMLAGGESGLRTPRVGDRGGLEPLPRRSASNQRRVPRHARVLRMTGALRWSTFTGGGPRRPRWPPAPRRSSPAAAPRPVGLGRTPLAPAPRRGRRILWSSRATS
jgi:regulator of RNase E activity RraA